MFKKIYYFLFCLLLLGSYTQAQRPFIFTVQVDSPVHSFKYRIFADQKFEYSYEKINSYLGGGAVVTKYTAAGPVYAYRDTFAFPDTGLYRIKVWRSTNTLLTDLSFGMVGQRLGYNTKYLDLEQWGDIQWANFPRFLFTNYGQPIRFLFEKHTNTDTPDFSRVTDMNRGLEECPLDSIPNIEYWDVSNVWNMNSMFRDYKKFNQNLNNWDVSSVKDLMLIFMNATSFNQPLDKWVFNDSLPSFAGMFAGATSFNQPLNDWDIKNVYFFNNMFKNAISFNQPLDKWKFEKRLGNNFAQDFSPYLRGQNGLQSLDSGFSFGAMFYNAKSFNQNINSWAKQWKQDRKNTHIISEYMFTHASNYNQPMDEWGVLPGDTSGLKIIFLDSLFANCSSFNQPIGNWDVSFINSSANETFYGCTHFNQPLGSWNVTNISSFRNMFKNAVSFNQDLGAWNLKRLFPGAQIGFTNSGMSCENYSKTIYAWAHNPNTAWGGVVKAEGLKYSPMIDTFDILEARGILMDSVVTKWNWKFIGDTLIGADCAPKQDTGSGINQANSFSVVQLYPNPVSNTLHLSNLPIGAAIAVYDVLGRKVYAATVQQSSLKINTESWSQGVYLVQLNYQGERWMSKVVK